MIKVESLRIDYDDVPAVHGLSLKGLL